MRSKVHTLSDGQQVTTKEVAERTGISITTARTRLTFSKNADYVLAPPTEGNPRKGKHRLYTLSDGSQWTVPEISLKIGSTAGCASARLARSRDPEYIFGPLKGSEAVERRQGMVAVKDRMIFGDREHWLLISRFT